MLGEYVLVVTKSTTVFEEGYGNQGVLSEKRRFVPTVCSSLL